MLQIFRHGIDISRHHLKGVYVWTIGKNRKQSSSPPAEIICTLREGRDFREVRDGDDGGERSTASSGPHQYGPISLSYDDMYVTLQPWDPYACVIAAGIHNRLIHFPILPGSRVFVLDCSLQTLGHIADIVGPQGRLVGVIGPKHPQRPDQAELRMFFKRYPGASILTEDVQQATFERYELLLGLPEACREAFLKGVSKFNLPPKVLGRIFDFVECNDAAKVKCLVVCHWPPETRVDVVRDVVLNHIDILQRFAAREKKTGDGDKVEEKAAAEKASSDTSNPQDEDDEDNTTGTDGNKPRHDRKEKKSKSSSDAVPQWVLLDLPTDNIITNNHAPDVNSKLTEVVDDMKRLSSGLRTGLLAKEQLLLMPYFPNRALLLLKYAAYRDDCKERISKRKVSSPPGLGAGMPGPKPKEDGKTKRTLQAHLTTMTENGAVQHTGAAIPARLGSSKAVSPPVINVPVPTFGSATSSTIKAGSAAGLPMSVEPQQPGPVATGPRNPGPVGVQLQRERLERLGSERLGGAIGMQAQPGGQSSAAGLWPSQHHGSFVSSLTEDYVRSWQPPEAAADPPPQAGVSGSVGFTNVTLGTHPGALAELLQSSMSMGGWRQQPAARAGQPLPSPNWGGAANTHQEGSSWLCHQGQQQQQQQQQLRQPPGLAPQAWGPAAYPAYGNGSAAPARGSGQRNSVQQAPHQAAAPHDYPAYAGSLPSGDPSQDQIRYVPMSF